MIQSPFIEDGDDSDDDDDVLVGGQTQDFKCPLTLTTLVDPLTTYVMIFILGCSLCLTFSQQNMQAFLLWCGYQRLLGRSLDYSQAVSSIWMQQDDLHLRPGGRCCAQETCTRRRPQGAAESGGRRRRGGYRVRTVRGNLWCHFDVSSFSTLTQPFVSQSMRHRPLKTSPGKCNTVLDCRPTAPRSSRHLLPQDRLLHRMCAWRKDLQLPRP